MRKILFGIGIASLIGLSSCEDKTETVIRPEAENGTLTFQVFTPENAQSVYTLLEEEGDKVMETLTFEKPDYGFNTARTYSVEISMEPEFEKSKTQALAAVSTSESLDLNTKELNMAILKLHELGNYPELTEAQDIYFRVKSVISNATPGPLDPNPIVKPAYSNTLQLTILPYKPANIALPATYYIIGIGGWDNKPENIGNCLIPLSLIPEFPYNQVDGSGTFEFTGYFKTSDEFKLVEKPGSWENAWGMADDGSYSTSGGNIKVNADGYYKIRLNTETNELTIKPAKVEFTPVEWIELIGVYNGWSDETVRMEPHAGSSMNVWYADITLDTDGGIKFRANGSWANPNWGGKSFPYGLKPSGDDIPALAGTYRVVFNQIDGCYFFFEPKKPETFSLQEYR